MNRLSARAMLTSTSLIILSSTAPAQVGAPPVKNEWDIRPLQMSDLIVRGKVVGVAGGEVLFSDFWSQPPAPEKERVGFVTISIEEVLRGPMLSGELKFMVHNEPLEVKSTFAHGAEMIVCLYYHPRLQSYYQTTFPSRYFRGTDGWFSGPTPDEETNFLDRELRQLTSETTLETIAQNAELVVEGTIASVESTLINGPDGGSAQLVTLVLNIDDTKKGPNFDTPIRIVVITRGAYWPEWRAKVPKKYSIGQRWLCFLKRKGDEWYPFAGSNGLFQVLNDKLVYAEHVEYWHSRSQVNKIVHRVKVEE